MKFDLQLFCGGGGVQQAPLSDEQKALISAGLPSAVAGGQLSANLINQFGNLINSGATGVVNPNYNNMSQNVNNAYSSMNQTANNLANGKVSQEMLDNQNKAMKYQYDNSFGSLINEKGKSGVINSSAMNKSMKNMQDSFAQASANNYNNNLNTQSNLLGQQANLVNNQISANNNLQAGSYVGLDKLYGYATGAPYTTSANNATSTANSQQSFVTQDNGFFGGLMSGVGSFMACFIAGTKVKTPSGDVNIEDIKVGDLVIGVDGVEIVIFVADPVISLDEYLTVSDDERSVTTTSTQPFITEEGDKLPRETGFKITPAEKEVVYDFSTSGSNSYFANGFAVRGRE